MDEINMRVILLTAVLGAIYVAIASIGIGQYNKCEAVQGVDKFENRKMFLSQTLTIMLTVPATLILFKMSSMISGPGRVGMPVIAILVGVLGIIASVFSYQLQNAEGCEDTTNNKNFVIIAMSVAVLMTDLGMGFLAYGQTTGGIHAYNKYIGKPIGPTLPNGTFQTLGRNIESITP